MSSLSRTSAISAAMACFLTGCATYHRAPLPQHANLMPSVMVPAAAIENNGRGPHRIDPTAPLDEATVAAIAVLNNPDLKARRLQAGVAEAQLFAAGLLPDPQLSIGLSRSSAHRGYKAGVAQEIQSILTRGARRSAARAQAGQVNLNLLWRESQVAEKARELFIPVSTEPRLRELLTANRDVLAKRYARDRLAMRQNAATVGTVAGDTAALAGVDAQLRELALQTNDAGHALHALLGLKPGASLHFRRPEVESIPSRRQFDAMLAALPKRRADLLALQAGYESQEEAVRAAVLGQFPAVSVGFDRARSAEEGVATVGLGVSVGLPIFSRNRGRIAIERATREQLRAEYQARLDQAVNDADRLWQKLQILATQRRQLDAEVMAMRTSAQAAEHEFNAGNLTLDEYANLQPGFYAREISAIRVDIALAQAKAALALISGTNVITPSTP